MPEPEHGRPEKIKSSGRFIQPESPRKLERPIIKNTFSPITELQNIVKIRFQLDYFSHDVVGTLEKKKVKKRKADFLL